MTTWAQHVGKFAKKHNIKLGQAMKNSKCKQEWKQMKHGGDAELEQKNLDGDAELEKNVDGGAELEKNVDGGAELEKNVDGGAELEQKNMEVKSEGGSRRRRRSMKKSSRRRGRSLKNKSRKNKK